jgi:hypothetical protein
MHPSHIRSRTFLKSAKRILSNHRQGVLRWGIGYHFIFDYIQKRTFFVDGGFAETAPMILANIKTISMFVMSNSY